MVNTAVPTRRKKVVMKTTPIRLINKPALTISPILTRPLPNTMALGGVAIGIIKAHDAESVAGIMSRRGLVFMATAMDARMGRIICVVAVLDVNSVRKVSVVQTTPIIARGLKPARN